MDLQSDVDDAVAIIGFSFRLPEDAIDEESLWNVLVDKRNLMTTWPKERAIVDSFQACDSDRPNTVRLPIPQYQICLSW